MTINGHFWIENEAGEVIYDPTFVDYKMICMLRKCNINKPHYRKASADRQREMISNHILPFMMAYKKKHSLTPFPKGWFEPISHCCSTNCIKQKMLGNKGKIVYGDMGWEMANGEVWWEFEDAVSDAEYMESCRIANAEFLKHSTREERRAVNKSEKKKKKKQKRAQTMAIETPTLIKTMAEWVMG
jgi:hypothetical protein